MHGDVVHSAVEGIFAVAALAEFARNPFRSPDLSARSFGMFPKGVISRCEMSIDGLLRGFERSVIAVVNDGSCHSAEHRFDDVEELRSGRQRGSLHNRETVGWPLVISFLDLCKELLGDMPRGRVPGQIDGLAVAILSAQEVHHFDHFERVLLVREEVGHLVAG
jgi:hypothetical protein